MSYTDAVVWEVIFMVLILKIPVVYLGAVVYWAIRAEPKPLEGASALAGDEIDPRPGWSRRPAPRRPHARPHGSPCRTPLRARRAALARAEVEK